jgi:hypothetical protein
MEAFVLPDEAKIADAVRGVLGTAPQTQSAETSAAAG